MKKYGLLLTALFVPLVFFSYAPHVAVAADYTACESDLNKTDCKGLTWITASHTCERSSSGSQLGLAYTCTDTDYQLCQTEEKEPCIIDTRTIPGIFQIADFVQQFVVLSQWGLGAVVALAALMFVWGGFQFLTAGGRSDKVESGKKIIGGTITGIIISFSAFVIINFVVFSLTNASVNTKTKQAGFIALLFPGLAEQQPFSGSGNNIENRTSCRSSNNTDWQKDCTSHVYCADTGEGTGGAIAKMQQKLNSLNCQCGAVSGCFDTNTVDCVRRFQLANLLPATGVIDAQTAATIEALPPVQKSCDLTDFNDATAVIGNLPKAVLPSTDYDYSNDVGCCIVADANTDLYCLENVTDLTCETLNGKQKNTYLRDKTCAGSNTDNRCGFCHTSKVAITAPDSNNCMQFATPAWCQTYARDASDAEPLEFTPSTCDYRCAGQCRHTLMINPK